MLFRITILLVSVVLGKVAVADTFLQGNCEDGSGVLRSKGELYVGTFVNGEKTGWATIHSDEGMYFGEVAKGKRNGEGMLLNLGKKKGSKFQEGTWKKGKFTKEGQMPPGGSLTSGWLGDVCGEFGSTFVYADGAIYIGGCR